MELDIKVLEVMTDPEKFKDYLRVAIHNHDLQKKAKRDWYYRNREAVSIKMKAAYAKKKAAAAAAEGGSLEAV